MSGGIIALGGRLLSTLGLLLFQADPYILLLYDLSESLHCHFANILIFDLALGTSWQTVAFNLTGAWALAAAVFYALHVLDGTSYYWPALAAGVLALLLLF